MDLVAAVTADGVFNVGKCHANSVDLARYPVQPDDGTGGHGRGVDRICAKVSVDHIGHMAQYSSIVRQLIGKHIAVVGAEIADDPDHDIRYGQRIASRVIDHPHSPLAARAFAAERLRLKSPGAVEVSSTAGIGDQLADGAAGRSNVDFHIGGEGGGKRHLDSDPFHHIIESSRAAERQAGGVGVGDHDRGVAHIHGIGELAGGHARTGPGDQPGFGQPHRRQRIDQAVSVVIAEMLATTVPGIGPVETPGKAFRPGDARADLAAHMPGRDAED